MTIVSCFFDAGPDIDFPDLAEAKENGGSAELKVRTLPLFVELGVSEFTT